MTQKKTIGNVNILDLRKTTPEAAGEIGEIGNVNLVLYTAETAGLLARINVGNLNAMAEVPSDGKVELIFNKTSLTHGYFEKLTAPVYLLVGGKVTIEPDVTSDDLEKGLSGLLNGGKILCPETLLGALRAKMTADFGQVMTYPAFKHLYKNSVNLDEAFLQNLENGSEVVIMGSLSVTKVLPDALIEQKLKRVFVWDNTLCHEENEGVLRARLMEGSGDFKVIPAGYEIVDQALHLDTTVLESLRVKKLYCKEMVQIDAEVAPAAFAAAVEGIIGEGWMVVPQALKSVFAQKCDLLKNQVVFYEGQLFVVEDEQTLYASYLDAVEGKISLLVTGELTIDPAVDAKTLAAHLAKVYNLGTIRCTPEQMGALQARMGLQKGSLEDSTHKEEAPAQANENYIGNANYLVL